MLPFTQVSPGLGYGLDKNSGEDFTIKYQKLKCATAEIGGKPEANGG